MTFGERLKFFRTENNMSQQDLAEKLIVTSQAVSKWENNISEPEFQIIQKITTIFKISHDQLFTDNDNGVYKGLITTVSKDTRMKIVYNFFTYFFSFLFLSFIIITFYTYGLDELTIHFPLGFGVIALVTGILLFYFSWLRDDFQRTPNKLLEVYGDRVIVMEDNVVIQLTNVISFVGRKYNVLEDIGSIKIVLDTKTYLIRNILGISELKKIIGEVQYMNTKGENV
jgi:transcriptional regulator with XRE-family HTH domain